MFPIALALVLLATLLAPSTADADRRGTVTVVARELAAPPRASLASADLVLAQRIAAAAWGDPCGGRVRVEVINFRRDARVHGADPLTWGAAVQDGCANGNDDGVVMLNSRRTYSRGRLRTVLCHEYGHLAGWRDPVTGDVHSSDPFSLMWPDQFPSLRDDGFQEHLRRDGHWTIRRPYADARCRIPVR